MSFKPRRGEIEGTDLEPATSQGYRYCVPLEQNHCGGGLELGLLSDPIFFEAKRILFEG
jgi:hypothetical protein